MHTDVSQREAQLQAMLSQYGDRMTQMKQVNHDTYQRLQQMIDSLRTDKELLRERLLKANHERLVD